MSELRANTISDVAGTGPVTLTKQSAAKVWVNFDGTSTVSIRDSLNVSSITDNRTGEYTVNFDTAMADANYAAVGTMKDSDGGSGSPLIFTPEVAAAQTSTLFRFSSRSTGSGNLFDSPTVSAVVVK